MIDAAVPTTPCPPWCEQIQCHEPNPADRYHQQLVVYRETGGTVAAADLAVVTFTSTIAADDVWIGLDLGEDVASITVSLERATRLLHALGDALRRVPEVC